MKKLLLLCLSVLSLNVYSSDNFNIHTNGDLSSRILSEIYFPNSTLFTYPGAAGINVWNNLVKDKKGVSIQVLAYTHLTPLTSPVYKTDPTQENELLGMITTSKALLLASHKSDIKTVSDLNKKEYTIAGVGESGVCRTLIEKLKNDRGFKFVYVPYKSGSQIKIDLIAGHIDASCQLGSTAVEMHKNNEARLLYDFTEGYNIQVRTYIFVSKEMSDEDRKTVVGLLNKKLSTNEIEKIQMNGMNLELHLGEKAKSIFSKERTFWKYWLTKLQQEAK